jgi:hypothetical protein
LGVDWPGHMVLDVSRAGAGAVIEFSLRFAESEDKRLPS